MKLRLKKKFSYKANRYKWFIQARILWIFWYDVENFGYPLKEIAEIEMKLLKHKYDNNK